MLRITLSAVLLTLAPVLTHAEDDTWREQSRVAPDHQGLTGVAVENARGITQVRPSGDGKLHVTVVKTARAGSRERSRDLAARTLVTTERQDGRLLLRVRYPKQEAMRVNLWEIEGTVQPRLQVRIALEVPPGLDVSLTTASGDLYSTGMASRQSLKTTSGDIEVDGARGDLEVTTTSGDADLAEVGRTRVRTASGDVEVGGLTGPLELSTTSGEVVVRDAADSLRLRSVSGDIRVLGAPRGVMIETTSGEIDVQEASARIDIAAASGSVRLVLGASPRSVDVSTSSGEIVARLTARAGCNIHMLTSSGALEIDAPIETRMVSRREVKAVIGDGRVPVRLESRSGDITVLRAGE